MKNIYILFIFFALVLYSCSSDDMKDVLITPNVGIGNISFNDTGRKVMAEYGAYERLTSVGGGGQTAFVMWYENGLAFQLDSVDTQGLSLQEVVDMSNELIDLDQKVITMVIMSPSEASTMEGISLGSSRNDVLTAFGDSDRTFGSAELYDGINMGFSYNSSDILTRMDLFSVR